MAKVERSQVIREYEDLVRGVAGKDGQPTYYFLVASAAFSDGRGDLFVAAGLGRALAARGCGVVLVDKPDWYTERPAGSIVVSMVADTDIRRIPGKCTVIAWIRNRTDEWLASPAFDLYDGVLTSSELSRREVERTFDGPTDVCRIGFDPDLFYPDGDVRDIRVATTANHWGSDRGVHVSMRALAAVGTDVAWYGIDRSNDPVLAGINRGALEFFDVAAIYRRSMVTIDDLHDVSIGYGNLNSRIFEALACGSLVVTNSALGLAEAGLEGVPVYRSADDLVQIVSAAATGAYDQTLEELIDNVRTNHSFEVRAVVFEEFGRRTLDEHARRSSRPTLHVYPDYSSTNPFQTLLYQEARKRGTVAPVIDIFNVPIARDPGGELTGHTLHLHWLNGVVQPGADLYEAFYRLGRFQDMIRAVKERGARIVWTVHNAMPHEVTYYFVERELYEFVAEEADVIHVMSVETAAATADLYPLPPEKTVVVEHPSFADAYPQMFDRPMARRRLGVHDDEISFLFFGAIRDYKGIPRLLDAFEIVSDSDARMRLDVAGGLGRTTTRGLAERMAAMGRVFPHIGFVDPADVQKYLVAADIFVLPYDNILNSGTAMLAATFGLPVVAPRLGQLKELEGEDWIEFFEPGSHESLAQAMERSAGTLRNDGARSAALSFAQQRDPETVARRFALDILGWES